MKENIDKKDSRKMKKVSGKSCFNLYSDTISAFSGDRYYFSS